MFKVIFYLPHRRPSKGSLLESSISVTQKQAIHIVAILYEPSCSFQLLNSFLDTPRNALLNCYTMITFCFFSFFFPHFSYKLPVASDFRWLVVYALINFCAICVSFRACVEKIYYAANFIFWLSDWLIFDPHLNRLARRKRKMAKKWSEIKSILNS